MYVCSSLLLHVSAEHMGHHQATLITWGDHCTVHLSFVPIGTSLLLLLISVIGYLSYFSQQPFHYNL
jgi:hypothetical protein